MKLFSRKALELSVFFGLLCSIVLPLARFDAACEDLRQNVLRLHIIANSDSAADQEVKLKVRDEILKETGGIFQTGATLEDAILLADENIELIEAAAQKVLTENGFDYQAKASIGDGYFETREYEDFTLPAGNYRSLIVRLGKAEGKNWWCVVFPSVCIPAACGSLSDTVSEKGTYIAENPTKFIMKFKTVEIYEDIKNFFNNK